MSKNSSAFLRIISLLDTESFVEIGAGVTARATDFNLAAKESASDGVITGYGLIFGKPVYIFCQDGDVLGGSIGEMHARKIQRVYDMALKMGAPVIGLLDSNGIRIEETCDALDALALLFQKQTESSGVVPQIIAVCGQCGGGLAALAALADFTFLCEKARLFVCSPDTIPGNNVNKCDTADPKFQFEKTGMIDAYGSEEEMIAQILSLVSFLPSNYRDEAILAESTDDLNRLVTGIDRNLPVDEMVKMIADHYRVFETKSGYSKDIYTALIRLDGITAGVIANKEPLVTPKGLRKAAEFVRFLDAFNIPIITLTAIKGFEASICAERSMAKAMAGLTAAFGGSNVPRVNVLVGDTYGSMYSIMNSKAMGADLVYAWPEINLGIMQSDMAGKLLRRYGDPDEIERACQKYEVKLKVEGPAVKRGSVDQIIKPEDTRKYLIAALEMLSTKGDGSSFRKHSAK